MRAPLQWKAVVVFVILAVALVGGIRGCSAPHPPTSLRGAHIVTLTNADYRVLSIAITNPSSYSMVYIACPPQVSSNGQWGQVSFPLGQPMAALAARQCTTLEVRVDAVVGEVRVPMLWGFSYPSQPTRWQQVKEDVLGRITGRNPRGMGALYTNFVSDMRL
jgi:hypothetical protein